MPQDGVPSGPLSTLESLRRDSVDGHARRMRLAHDKLTRCEAAFATAHTEQLHCEGQLSLEREAFAAARSVRALQGIERRLRACDGELLAATERARRAASAVTSARAELDALRQALLSAERDRRAASGALQNQRSAQLRVSAQREEDEADDAFRARR